MANSQLLVKIGLIVKLSRTLSMDIIILILIGMDLPDCVRVSANKDDENERLFHFGQQSSSLNYHHSTKEEKDI